MNVIVYSFGKKSLNPLEKWREKPAKSIDKKPSNPNRKLKRKTDDLKKVSIESCRWKTFQPSG